MLLIYFVLITARSPLYSHLTSTLQGLATIRSFNVQNALIKQFYKFQDDNTACYFLFVASSRGIGVMIEYVTALYVCITTAAVMDFYQSNIILINWLIKLIKSNLMK